MTPRMERMVEAMWATLDAESVEEIRAGMQRILGRKFTITAKTVHNLLYFVRQNPDDCGYTVHHAKRGPLAAEEGKRYIGVLIQPDGSIQKFDRDARHCFDQGAIGTLRSTVSQTFALKTSMEAGIAYEPSQTRKDIYGEVQDALEMAHKIAKRALAKIA